MAGTVFLDLNGAVDDGTEGDIEIDVGSPDEKVVLVDDKTKTGEELTVAGDDNLQAIDEDMPPPGELPPGMEKLPPEMQKRLWREQRAKNRQRERADAAEASAREERAARVAAEDRIKALETRVATVEQAAPPPTATLDAEMVQARKDLAQAIRDADVDKQVELQEKLGNLSLKREIVNAQVNARRAATAAAANAGVEKEKPAAPKTYAGAVDWQKRNKTWFDQDGYEAQSAAVRAIDKKMANDGWDPNDSDYYAELDNRIKTEGVRIPQARQARTTVAGAQRGSEQSGVVGNRVTITAEDRQTMRQFKLDPNNPDHLKRFAQEKQAEARRSRAN